MMMMMMMMKQHKGRSAPDLWGPHGLEESKRQGYLTIQGWKMASTKT